LGVELLVVKVKGEGSIERGGVRDAAAGTWDRLLGVAGSLGEAVAECGERVGWTAGRGEAGAVGGGRRGGAGASATRFGGLAVGLRGGGLIPKGLRRA
jgi:hypothetical protein